MVYLQRLTKYFPALLITVLCLGLLVCFTLVIETVTYPGFMSKRVPIYNNWLAILIVIIFSQAIIFLKETYGAMLPKWQTLLVTISKLLLYLSLILVLLTAVLYVLEDINYPNFVFSTLHIHHKGLLLVSILVTYLAFFTQYILKNDFLSKFPAVIGQFIPVIGVLILGYLLPNTIQSSTVLINNTQFMIANPTATYEQKMEYSWGWFYTYMQFIVTSTPPDAIIAIPKQKAPWVNSGNAGLVRYFLYPRYVVDPLSITTFESTPTHALIVRNEMGLENTLETLWPLVATSSANIHVIDPNTKETKVLQIDEYKPEDFVATPYWGVITLK